MKTVSKLSIFALSILLVSCNEKVSPELQSSNSTTPLPTPTSTTPEEFYFSVTDASPTMANFKLHKTGAGNAAAKCEVRNTTGITNDDFRIPNSPNDITCYFEAEELGLYFNGFSFDINASKNTCDYVAYSPFGFYDWMPGDSTGEYTHVLCANSDTGNGNVAAGAADEGVNATVAGGGTIGCNQMASNDIPVATREAFTYTDDIDLCHYNHQKQAGPNCDIGEITVNVLTVTRTLATDTTPETVTGTLEERTINCGGAVAACVEGPTKELESNEARTTEITAAVKDQVVKQSYSLPGLIEGKYQSNRKYVNYRRDLASKNINFITALNLPAAYKSVWADPSYSKIFDPQVMDFYKENLMMDGSTQIINTASNPTTDWDNIAISDNKHKWRPYALEPFVGLVNTTDPTDIKGEYVNPFYTFYCLDTAWDIKARIRMMVRDWDRIYPTATGDLELLSDLFRGASARQDMANYVEVSADLDGNIMFNDRGDWDDYIPMTRTPGAFDPFTTIWEPAVGFFVESRFTRGKAKGFGNL